jgi:hypothetical protein
MSCVPFVPRLRAGFGQIFHIFISCTATTHIMRRGKSDRCLRHATTFLNAISALDHMGFSADGTCVKGARISSDIQFNPALLLIMQSITK